MLGFSKKEDGIEEDDKIFVSISTVLFNEWRVFSTYERTGLRHFS
jgi:hypothetical protein